MRYNVGIFGGSFNPLHMGHLDCILRGAGECKKLYLILSIGTNRGEIDGRIRYRWLYQLTKHIGNVEILMLEDAAPTKAAYDETQWLADAQTIREQIGEPIDVVYCGSDYDENSFWAKCYPESKLCIFKRNEISSTAIRENPYAHWDWLPRVVRPYYVKKVLLMGTESVGKSTLTIHLAHRFRTNYIEEAGRELSEKSGTDLLMLSEDFTEILLRQKLNELEAVEASERVLFVDTDAMITKFYLEFLEDPNIRRNTALADAISDLNRYDLILFLEPDVAFVQDGDRSEVIAENRSYYSNKLKGLLAERSLPYVCLNGDYVNRYAQAVSAVEALFSPTE